MDDKGNTVNTNGKPFTFAEYQREALRTGAPQDEHLYQSLSLVGLGLTGEAGEVADIIKKIIHHGHALTVEKREKLEEELGDVLWYIAHAANVLGIDMDEIARGNVRKVARRYPDGFSSERSINRASEGGAK